MKKVLSLFALVAMLTLTAVHSFADDAKKEVTLKGTAVCAKCSLHQTDHCQAALKVTEDGKEVVYYVKGTEGKELHKEVCKKDKENVSITGVVSEKDGQKWITPSKVE